MSREAMQQALEALEKVIEAFGPGLTLQQRAITALRQALETEYKQARSLTDELMDCVDRLGSEAGTVDPRVWDHLLVYAPKPQEEPVAWISESDNLLSWDKFYDHMKPLYTAPLKREWVGLTDEEHDSIKHNYHNMTWTLEKFARAVEQALKEKNT